MATPEFILKLREKIGHDPLWLIGVTAYVEDGRGRVLLGRRADNGAWALICGINEPGEEPALTAVREVREEAGVDCAPRALVRVSAQGRETVYANGDRTQYLDLLFLCEIDPAGSAEAYVADDESLEVGWFAPDELPAGLLPSMRERIEAVAAWRAAGAGPALFGL